MKKLDRLTKGLKEIPMDHIDESPYQGRQDLAFPEAEIIISHDNDGPAGAKNDNQTDKVETQINKVHKDPRKFKSLEELQHNIGLHGLINPIIVRHKGSDRFEIIDGHRRWQACKGLKWKTIAAVVLTNENQEESDKMAQTLSIISNLEREKLSTIDKAVAFRKVLDEGIFKNQLELAAALAIDQSLLGDTLNILDMDYRIVEDLKKTRAIKDVRTLRLIRQFDLPASIEGKNVSEIQWKYYSNCQGQKSPRSYLSEELKSKENSTEVSVDQLIKWVKKTKNIPVEIRKEIMEFIDSKISDSKKFNNI